MIPDKFFKSKHQQPTACTVGELKRVLAELPDTLAVTGDFSEAVELVVFNRGREDEHLEIRDHDT